MEILDYIKDKTIIVCNSSYKKYILDKVSDSDKVYHLKFYSRKDFIDHYYFSYDYLTISYVMEKYNVSYDTACIYLNNLVYVNGDSDFSNLKFLYNLKEELISEKLLYFDDSFTNYLKDYHILFVGIPYFTKLEEDMIKKLKLTNSLEIVNDNNKYVREIVYHATYMEDEISFVCDRISSLLHDGVDINRIKLCNVSDDYINCIEKIFGFYNIPICFDKHYLFGLNIAKEFLDLYEDKSLEEVIDILKDKYDKSLLNKIVSIVNKYVLIENKDIKRQFIIHDMKCSFVGDILNNRVSVIDLLNDYIDKDDYVFLINFNQNAVLKFVKDEDYITDVMKDKLLIDLVKDTNIKIKEATIKRLFSINNLVISYKDESFYNSFYPSNLISELGLKVVLVDKKLVSYSNLYSSLKLASMLDNFIMYGQKDEDLEIFYSNFPILYRKYDNRYSILDDDFKNYYKEGLVLSYSNMNMYNLCNFAYYVSNVLNLNIYEDNFASYIGSLFHYVLQHYFKDNISILDSVNSFTLNNRELNAKENFFVSKLVKEIEFVVNSIEKQMKFSSLDKALYEERIVVDIKDEVPVIFKGFVDKLLYKDVLGKKVVAIIDYKTGNCDIDLSLSKYGINLQLPVYLYLVKNGLDKNVIFAGFYLQKILNDVPLIDKDEDILVNKYKNLKLKGYSNSDFDILSLFDKSYKDSEVISSMKIKNNGDFYSYSKVLSNLEIDNLINLVQEQILKTKEGILNRRFDINPKKVALVNLGCRFCKFKDICFVSSGDVVELQKEKDLSFLGGDVDA